MSDDIQLLGVGLETDRRRLGAHAVAPTASPTTLARTRSFGSASALTQRVSQVGSLIHERVLNTHTVTWPSGQYVRFDLPATPIIVQDRADASRYVFRVTDTGSGYFSGAVTAGSFAGGAIDVPSVGASGFHVDVSGNFAAGGSSATSGPLTVNATTGALVGSGATLHTVTVDGGINAAGSGILFGPSGADINATGYLQLPEIADTYQVPAGVQVRSNSGSGTAVTAAAWSPATTAGNLLVMAVWWLSSATVSTPPTGYTLIGVVSGTPKIALYYKQNCSASESAPSLTLSSSTSWQVHTREYSGIATTSSLDGQAASSSVNNNSTLTGGAITTTQASELWLVAGGTSNPASSFSAETNGYAEVADAGGLALWEKFATSTGSAAMQATLSSVASWTSKSATFKAAGNVGVATPAANRVRFYAKDKSGASALYWLSDSGTEYDLTQLGAFGTAGGDLAGTYPNPTVVQASDAFAFKGDITTPQLTANQNNYNPSSLSLASILRLDVDTNRTITGLAGGSEGRVLYLVNVATGSTVSITLADSSTSSSAANRFLCPNGVDYVLGPNGTAKLLYDTVNSRWRVFPHSSLASANPAALGTAAPGSGNTGARSDHVHPTTGLGLLAAANTFTVAPQTITINSAGNNGLVVNLASGQTARAFRVFDSDAVESFAMAGSGADILFTQYGGAVPILAGRAANGTNLSPTALALDDTILEVGGRGYGTSFAAQSKAAIQFNAAEAWSNTVQGTYLAFYTAKKGGTTRGERFRVPDDAAFQFPEVTTPAAPPTNSVKLYADDNGSGKTRVMALFNTGAAVQVAIQP